MNTPATKIPVPPQPPKPEPIKMLMLCEQVSRIAPILGQKLEVLLAPQGANGNGSWVQPNSPFPVRAAGLFPITLTNYKAFGFFEPGAEYEVTITKVLRP